MNEEIIGQAANVALTVVCVSVIPWGIKVSRDLALIKLNQRTQARVYLQLRKQQRWTRLKIKQLEARLPPAKGGA